MLPRAVAEVVLGRRPAKRRPGWDMLSGVQNPSLVMTTHPRALKRLSKLNGLDLAHIGMTEPRSHPQIHHVKILIQFLPREPILNREAHGNFPRVKVTSPAVAATVRSPGNLVDRELQVRPLTQFLGPRLCVFGRLSRCCFGIHDS